MEELQLTLTPARVDQKNFGIQLANWRVGQQLTALVVDTRPNGGLVLSVAGKTFLASSDLPVQPGTRMAMEVKQAGAELVLRRLPDPNQPSISQQVLLIDFSACVLGQVLQTRTMDQQTMIIAKSS